MSNEKHSRWYYVSGTVYHFIKVLGALVGVGSALYLWQQSNKPVVSTPEPLVKVSNIPASNIRQQTLQAALNIWLKDRDPNQISTLYETQAVLPTATVNKEIGVNELENAGEIQSYLILLSAKPSTHQLKVVKITMDAQHFIDKMTLAEQ